MEKLHRLAVRVVLISLIAVAVVCAAEAWVRWELNQDFTFFGGVELEVITAGAFVLLITLVWKGRSSE